MHAKFPVMQTWWGQVGLKMKASTDSLIFYRYAPSTGTRMLIKFNAKDEDGTLVKFSMPIHFFSKVEHTERDSSVDHPTALIFHLTKKGFQRIVKKLPGIVKSAVPKLEAHNRELSKTICFVLDPSYVCLFENGVILYRPRYLDILKTFKLNYNEEWENHLNENRLFSGTYENRIVPINKADFDAYYKSNGLRNIDSKIPLDFRKQSLRIFIQRRDVKRKPPGKGRGTTRAKKEEDSDEEGEEEDGTEESQDSSEKDDFDEDYGWTQQQLEEKDVDEEDDDYDNDEEEEEEKEIPDEPEEPKEHEFVAPKTIPRRKRK